MNRVLSLDFETFSDIDIASCGSYRYMESPNFEILLMAYAYDDEPVTVIDLINGETVPQSVLDDIQNPEVTKTAWNCAFEREAIRRQWGIYCDPQQWEDTMILAAQCGLPRNLAGASEALGLKEDEAKMKEGKALIKYFCCPCKPTRTNGERERNYPEHAPEKWEVFKKYNGMDVVAERAIRNRLIQWKPLPEEHDFWCLDARINEHGVRIDRQLATNAVRMDTKNKDELTEQAVALTGMDNPKSTAQIKAWLADQEGKEFPSLNKKVIADVVSELKTEDAKKFMDLRSELSKSSTAKYMAMLRSMSPKDDHVRGCFSFYGASRTGRFAGSLVQFQNLSKNYDACLDGMRTLVKDGHYTALKALYGCVADPLSQLVRTAIIPEDGHKILVADFSAIEARVLAWLSGEQWVLDAFKAGKDIYCVTASQMFKVPVEKHGQNSELRQKGKTAILACIAEDSPVLTKRGPIPIQEVTTDDELWDGNQWVHHDGVIYKGEKEVITYGGLTATKDHVVYTWEYGAVHFGYAASRGAHLIQAGDGWNGIRPCSACKPREEMEQRLEQMLCAHKMSRLWSRIVVRYARTYDILNAGPNHRFTASGVLVHNCGYGGGVNALKAFGADKMGMTEEEMQETVDMWRDANPHTVQLWKVAENAAIRCVVRKTSTVSELSHTRFDYDHGILFMTLPSGRRLAYWGAEYGESRFHPGKKTLSYMGVDQHTKKWSRIETWGGKIVENMTQGTARDILREAMFALDREGYQVIAHVHDECIVTEPISSSRTYEDMANTMCPDIPWAKGLPLAAAGYDGDYYFKD